MLYVTFHIRSLGTLWNYFRKLMLSTFLIGGILAALLRGFPMGRNYLPGIGMTLGVGAFSGWILVRGRKRKRNKPAIVRLCYRSGGTVAHSCIGRLRQYLTEPISGARYRCWTHGYFIGCGRRDCLDSG